MSQILNQFWSPDEISNPISTEMFLQFEQRHDVVVPHFLKQIYQVSDGDCWTNYIYLKDINGKIYSTIVGNRLNEFSDWCKASDFSSLFDIADESIYGYLNDLKKCIVFFRHGFEYFVIFKSKTHDHFAEIIIVDLAFKKITEFQIFDDIEKCFSDQKPVE